MAIVYDIIAITPGLSVVQDFDGGNVPIYLGEASPGSSTASGVWRIRKFTYTDNKQTAVEWAEGEGTFTKFWTGRTAYLYS